MSFEISPCQTPIVFIIFNRPELTRRVFSRIAQVKPTRLLIVADGARADRPGETEISERVRAIALAVDWPCKVQTNFASSNMGCRSRLVSGLTWAFEQVEQAIILEDDVLPDLSFFPFCEEMLARFSDDDRISMITGFNIVQDSTKTGDSYFYSRMTHIWGWATWRRSWARYDEHLAQWPAIRASGLLQSLFKEPAQYRFWARIFDQMHQGTGPDTWDYQWVYTNLINHALSVVPRVNLIANIGFGPEATHTTKVEDTPTLAVGSLTFPLRHPPAIIPWSKLDELEGRLSGTTIPNIARRIFSKIGRILGRAR
jgi:hypothetical protein